MNNDTVNLLKECNAGCKSATDNIGLVKPHIHDVAFGSIIDKYNDAHANIGDECHVMLNDAGESEKDPKPIPQAFAKITTQFKLANDNGVRQIAGIMADGCNMGIRSVCNYIKQYPTASEESMTLARRLIKTEQNFLNEMISFM